MKDFVGIDNVANISTIPFCRHNNSYAAEIAHNVSSKKRIEILAKAKVLGVKVTNAHARVRAEEA